MKKILSLLLIISFLSVSVFAAEPFVVLSTVSPLALYSGSMEAESYDISLYPEYYGTPVIVPFLVKDSGLSFDDLISNNPFKVGNAIFDIIVLSSSVSDFYPLSGTGTLTITPDMSSIAEGNASVSLRYDDVSLMYQAGGYTESSSIDGISTVTLSWSGDSIFTLTVDADTTLSENGNISLDVYLDYDTLDSYLSISGFTLSDLRPYVLEMLMTEFSPEVVSVFTGVDITNMDFDEIVSALEKRNMLDILDSLVFIIMASDDYRLSSTDPFTMCFSPKLSIDGTPRDDFDIGKIIKSCVRIYHFTEMF